MMSRVRGAVVCVSVDLRDRHGEAAVLVGEDLDYLIARPSRYPIQRFLLSLGFFGAEDRLRQNIACAPTSIAVGASAKLVVKEPRALNL